MKKGRKPDYLEKTPDTKLKKMAHTKTRNFNPLPKLETALQLW